MPYNYTLLVGSDYKFNTTAYQDYSPLYLSASFMMTYMLAIALATCAITHTILYHGPKIVKSFKAADIEKDDVHAKLMRAYPEVPMWFVLLFSFSSLLVLLSPDAFSTGSLPLQVVRRIIRCLLRPWDRRCRRELPSFSHHLRIKLSLTRLLPFRPTLRTSQSGVSSSPSASLPSTSYHLDTSLQQQDSRFVRLSLSTTHLDSFAGSSPFFYYFLSVKFG
jgi:hypothetical protein